MLGFLRQPNLPGWLSKLGDEIFRRYFGLPQKPCKGSNLDFSMKRHHAPVVTFLHDNVTSSLPYVLKSKLFKRSNDFSAGKYRQFRHAQEW